MVGHGFSSFCVSGQYFATKGCLQRGESLISGSGGRKGGQERVPFGVDGLARGDGPEGRIGQQAADELGMQRVASFVGLHACQKRQSGQSQVTDQVQGLVAPELVGEAQWTVQDPVVRKNNGIFERTAPNQAHGPQRLDVSLETEGSSASQQMAESIGPNHHLHFLLTDKGMWKIHVAPNVKLTGGINPDPAVSFGDFQGLEYFQVPPLPAQLSNAGLFQHLHERLGRTIQNGHLDRVDVDVDVVDAAGKDGGKQVLRCGEQNALFHEARGVTYACDVVPLGFDGEVIQVDAAKDDACFGRRRHQTNVTLHTSVETHTFSECFSCDGSLEHAPSDYCSMLLANINCVCALLSIG